MTLKTNNTSVKPGGDGRVLRLRGLPLEWFSSGDVLASSQNPSILRTVLRMHGREGGWRMADLRGIVTPPSSCTGDLFTAVSSPEKLGSGTGPCTAGPLERGWCPKTATLPDTLPLQPVAAPCVFVPVVLRDTSHVYFYGNLFHNAAASLEFSSRTKGKWCDLSGHKVHRRWWLAVATGPGDRDQRNGAQRMQPGRPPRTPVLCRPPVRMLRF